MTDDKIDLWAIADEVDELADGWEPGAELPAEVTADAEWVRKRLLALRFTREDLDALEAEYSESAQHLRKSFATEMELLDSRHDSIVGPLLVRAEALEAQLTAYHRQALDEDERLGRKKPRTTIKTLHGTMKSRAPSAKVLVEVLDQDQAVKWLDEHGLGHYVSVSTPKPPVVTVDKVGIRDAVAWGDGPLGVVDAETGEVCPFLRVAETVRKFEVET